MGKSLRVLASLAAGSLVMVMSPVAAQADHAEGEYHATLNELNGSGGSGMATVTVEGEEATVEVSWEGLPETFEDGPYPHVQHIHVGAEGQCPDMSRDENGDGIVDTVEGQPDYGEIGTTLSTEGDTSPDAGTNIDTAPGGSSTEYSRTFTLNEETQDSLAEDTGVIVVHGLDPSTLSDEAANADSNLAPELPLAATAPALCGAVDPMPDGGVDTGAASVAGADQPWLFAVGGGLLVGAALLSALRRRSAPEGH